MTYPHSSRMTSTRVIATPPTPGSARDPVPGHPTTRAGACGPVRVFHLIKSLGRGGAETLLPESLRFADRERFDYAYGYFLPWKDAMVATLAGLDAPVTCFDAPGAAQILLAARRVARHLRRARVDVLHCHLPVAGIVGRIAGRLAGVPVVYTEHNTLERYHPLTRRLHLAAWGWYDRLIAVSADVAESIRRHAGDAVPVSVVLNGVDVERFDRRAADGAALRSRLRIPHDAPVVGTVAVFRTQKRLDLWLDAARAIHERCPSARFVIVGDGPLRAEMTAHLASLELDGVAHLVGLQEDVRPYLAAMDVYMMSSAFEGLPVALLEAMAMECAVVTTGVGGIPEVVRDGTHGAIVPAGRPDLLAAAAADLLVRPDIVRAAGVAARRMVEGRFGMRRMIADLEALYVDVLTRRGCRHRPTSSFASASNAPFTAGVAP
jgi:L-malate glycosyltransferase